jgi:hypothetical protein
MKVFSLLFFLILGSCCAETGLKNTVSLSGGMMEMIDVEYQRDFDPFYVSIKPGFLVMLIYYSTVHGWPAYPSIRLGADLVKFRSIRIGAQFECAYFYSSPAENSIAIAGNSLAKNNGADSGMAIYYRKEFKTDHLVISFGPAIRCLWHRFELQGCIGIQYDNSVEFTKEYTYNTTKKTVTIPKIAILPLGRISLGVRL